MTRDGSTRDEGFTLVELVICITLMAVIAPVLLGVMVVTLKSSPALADRADAAVIVQGLVTWLPEDIDSAAPGSFDTAPATPSGCLGTDPGFNLLKLSWTETISSAKNYTASYRYVAKPVPSEGGRIVRVYCEVGTTQEVLNVTSVIPPWTAPPSSFARRDLR